jgi:hypothetical protein
MASETSRAAHIIYIRAKGVRPRGCNLDLVSVIVGGWKFLSRVGGWLGVGARRIAMHIMCALDTGAAASTQEWGGLLIDSRRCPPSSIWRAAQAPTRQIADGVPNNIDADQLITQLQSSAAKMAIRGGVTVRQFRPARVKKPPACIWSILHQAQPH